MVGGGFLPGRDLFRASLRGARAATEAVRVDQQNLVQARVIDRIIELYSNPNEVVLTPFMGVGSEVYSPVSMGRKAIGIELKDSYYKQAILNLKEAGKRFDNTKKQLTLI